MCLLAVLGLQLLGRHPRHHSGDPQVPIGF